MLMLRLSGRERLCYCEQIAYMKVLRQIVAYRIATVALRMSVFVPSKQLQAL